MQWIFNIANWFTGDASGRHNYMPLWQCMNKDVFWVALTVCLDLSVAAGYVLIAWHWWKNQRSLQESPAKAALGNLRNIFLFCCICGYLFIPIKLVWPAWRLYDIFLAALVFWTWRYAWNANELKVIYSQISRSDRLSRQLSASRTELLRKNTFLNAVSHDLRTPLNGLSLQARLADNALAAGNIEAAQAALKNINECIKSTGNVLDRFLRVAALDASGATQRIRCLPEALLQATADAISPAAAAKGLALRVSCQYNDPIMTDPQLLLQALQLLAVNAVKFTQKGVVVLRSSSDEQGIYFDVLDSGPGISPQQQELILEDFYQGTNPNRDPAAGLGLGLTTVRRLCARLDGNLVVESVAGRGSRFGLVLPLSAAENPHGPEAAADATPVPQ